MSLFDQLGGRQPQMNPMQMLGQLRSNPASVLQQAGLNIPAGMNNPQQIVQHLLQSGQVGQGRLMQAQQMASQMLPPARRR